MILVDTNVWREFSHPQGDQAVKRWFLDNDPELMLSAIVVGEIHYGIRQLAVGRKRNELAQWAADLEREHSDEILNFDAKSARAYGEIASAAKMRGENPGTADMQIAAQAKAYGLSLATRNVKDFSFAGIEVIDPWND